MRLRRAVSLVPSATDTLVALGAADALVGISSDCDQPDPGALLPVVTGAMIDAAAAAADSAGADLAVREQLESGGSLYELDVAAVVALAPEIVFAQDHCAVCAVPSSEVTSALAGRGLGCEVVSLDPVGLDDVLSSFARIGRAVGAGEAGEALEASSRRRLADLGLALRSQPAGRRPRVVVLDWVDPPFAAGNWVPELVEAAGGEAVLGGGRREAGGAEAGGTGGAGGAEVADAGMAAAVAGDAGGADAAAGAGGAAGGAAAAVTNVGRAVPSRQVSVDAVVAARPDLVVVAPCGLGLEAATDAARVVAGWFNSPPSRDGERPRVVAFDGRLWFSRPGPCLVEGAEALSALLKGQRLDGSTGAYRVVEITEDADHDRGHVGFVGRE